MKSIRKKTDEWALPPLKKHVAMIQVSNDISLLQRKLSNILLQNAYDELTVKDKHSISLAHLCSLAGFNSKNFEYLQESLRGLQRTSIEWNIVQEGTKLKKTWGIASILANCEIKDSLCIYSYGGVLSEKLKNPEFFARIDLRMQQRFTSSYALALYENCLRYVDIGQTAWFSVDLLKKLLGAHTQKQYETFWRFSQRVLKVAIDEVNQVSDIQIEANFQRENRQTIAVQFKVERNPQNSLELGQCVDLLELNKQIYDLLQSDFGFSGKQAQDTCKAYSEDYIRSKMALTRNYAEKNEIKNVRSFLLAALRDDYVDTQTFVDRKKIKKQTSTRQSQQSALAIEEQAIKANVNAIDDYLASLSEFERDSLDKCFLQSLSPRLRTSFEQNGLKSRSVKMVFDAFVAKRIHERAIA